jgi:hypothetical protein
MVMPVACLGLKVDPCPADTESVQQPRQNQPLVALRATRQAALLTWDLPTELVDAVTKKLTADGWSVVTTTSDGPRRRLLPRIDQDSVPGADQPPNRP